jgi:hypothetical protein
MNAARYAGHVPVGPLRGCAQAGSSQAQQGSHNESTTTQRFVGLLSADFLLLIQLICIGCCKAVDTVRADTIPRLKSYNCHEG